MKIQYFTATENLESLKSQYHKLAFKFHPDHGGSTAVMQIVNAEYAYLLANFANTSARTRQAEAHAEGRRSAADYVDIDQVTGILREKIEAALNLAGIQVELCGLWVWVTGDTKPHAATLGYNGLGFKWAKNKQAWFFAGVKSFNRTEISLDEIRNTYGSQVFKQADQVRQIPA